VTLGDSEVLTYLRYTWSSVIATMFIAAAEFSAYWRLAETWQIIIFYFICPGTIGAINWLGVKVQPFSEVEVLVPDIP
jgi:hypothetical protein